MQDIKVAIGVQLPAFVAYIYGSWMKIEPEPAFLAIQDAISDGTKNFLATLSQDWAGETMYGFVLETDCEGTSVEAVAGTEEGLLRIARYYAAREGKEDADSIDCQRTQLRWGSPEDGWYANYEAGFFARANQLLSEAHAAGLMQIFDGQLQQLCLEVLRRLDTDRMFGTSQTREKVTIGICYVGGDQSDEEFLRWVEAVNPPVVVDRLRYELQKSDRLFEAARESRLNSHQV